MRGGWVADRDDLYAQAGVGPADVDFVQAYDDYPVITLMQIEDLGFCAKGDGPAFVRRHRFTTDGDFPLNTSAASCRSARPGAQAATSGVVETIRQLTDDAGARQVPHARVGLVSGFGMINFDRGLATGAALLGRAA